MNDKQFRDVAIVAGAALLLWLLWRWHLSKNGSPAPFSQPQVSTTVPNNSTGANSPINLVFANNPQAFTPPNISLSITPQLPAGLSDQYIPLFGFVGIAQGVTLQT